MFILNVWGKNEDKKRDKKGVSSMFHDPRGTGWGQSTKSNNKGRMGQKN